MTPREWWVHAGTDYPYVDLAYHKKHVDETDYPEWKELLIHVIEYPVYQAMKARAEKAEVFREAADRGFEKLDAKLIASVEHCRALVIELDKTRAEADSLRLLAEKQNEAAKKLVEREWTEVIKFIRGLTLRDWSHSRDIKHAAAELSDALVVEFKKRAALEGVK